MHPRGSTFEAALRTHLGFPLSDPLKSCFLQHRVLLALAEAVLLHFHPKD